MLGDDRTHEAQQVARKPRHLLLLRHDPPGRKIGLELLRAKGLVGVCHPPHDVADAGDLVKHGLDPVARVVELDQCFGDLRNGHPLDEVGEVALVGERRPVVDRDQPVLGALVDELRRSTRAGALPMSMMSMSWPIRPSAST